MMLPTAAASAQNTSAASVSTQPASTLAAMTRSRWGTSVNVVSAVR